MINFENKKVLFIDLDSTLIKTVSGKTFPEDITDFRVQLPVLDKIDKYLERLYSHIQVINLEYTILDIDSEKGYAEYKAIIKVNNKYYSFDYYQSPYWSFTDEVDADMDLSEVFPKEVTTVIYV